MKNSTRAVASGHWGGQLYQLGNHVTVFDQVLWSTAEVRQLDVTDVEPELSVERGEDLLVVDRSVLGHFGKAIGRTNDLPHLHAATSQDASGNLRPMIAATIGVDPGCPTHLSPHDDRHILFQPTFTEVVHERQKALFQSG